MDPNFETDFGHKYKDDDNIIRTTPLNYRPQGSLGVEFFRYMNLHKDQIAQYMASTEQELTYEELLTRSIRAALKIQSYNFSQGDVICLCTNNNENSIVPFLAGLFLGLKVASLDPTLSLEDVIHLIKQVKPTIFFLIPESQQLIEEAIQQADLEARLVIFGGTDQHEEFASYLEPNDDEATFEPVSISIYDTAIIFFSSGTTGLPKGICQNSYAVLCQGQNIVDSHIVTSITLLYSSLYWISSVLLVTAAIISGTARVIVENFNPHDIWLLIEKYKISTIFLAPIQALEMFKVGRPDGINTSSLLCLNTGGGQFPEKLLLALRDLLPGTHVAQAYGQTEVAGVITLFNLANVKEILLLHNKPKSVGTPMLGIDYKVVDGETEKILDVNQTGELRVKTEYVMNGYYGLDSSESFDADGWLKTGDVVYFDEDLCFFIVDRIKEMLKYKSWHIAPAFLENILNTHPAIRRSVVIGLPDEEDGDHPLGLVMLNPNHSDVTEQEIVEFVNERVSDRQKLRAGVKFVDNFPMTPSGKVKRILLKKMVLNGDI